MALPQLVWDWGTAYDLFVSLSVLHNPSEFGVRGAWAAGVRARLPATERETLEQVQLVVDAVPLHWIHHLPGPKDGATVLWALGQIPPAERLAALLAAHAPAAETLRNVKARGTWDETDRKALLQCCKGKPPSPEEVTITLERWAHAEEFGERYLEALRVYQENFFAEEEKRIRPALQEALARVQELAQQLALPDLLEEISQGLRLSEVPDVSELVLAPSYWCTPLAFFEFDPDNQSGIWLFGARPPDASLVPGEVVPDALLRVLQALSDPTRLRILRYLAEEPLTPAQLARHLRLRAPTVTHHLKALRLASLVRMTIQEGKETKYAARSEMVAAACVALKNFLGFSWDSGEKLAQGGQRSLYRVL